MRRFEEVARPVESDVCINFEEFKQDALRTESRPDVLMKKRLLENTRQMHSILGMLTEIGELADQYKRHIFYGTPLDLINVQEEIGDLNWYLALMVDQEEIELITCLKMIIAKLRKRYPEKFGTTEAATRDLSEERKVLNEHAMPPRSQIMKEGSDPL